MTGYRGVLLNEKAVNLVGNAEVPNAVESPFQHLPLLQGVTLEFVALRRLMLASGHVHVLGIDALASICSSPLSRDIYRFAKDAEEVRPPDGSVWALVGRHGAMKPVGRVRGRASMMWA